MLPNNPLFRKPAALEPYLIAAIVLLVGLGAFGLGRLSAASGQKGTLRIIYPDAKAAAPLANTAAVANAAEALQAAPESAPAGQGAYVASKSGTKYYLAACSGASRIKQENRVYFVSKDDAVAAGYGPAANCPGL
jgi:hypothetical protein